MVAVCFLFIPSFTPMVFFAWEAGSRIPSCLMLICTQWFFMASLCSQNWLSSQSTSDCSMLVQCWWLWLLLDASTFSACRRLFDLWLGSVSPVALDPFHRRWDSSQWKGSHLGLYLRRWGRRRRPTAWKSKRTFVFLSLSVKAVNLEAVPVQPSLQVYYSSWVPDIDLEWQWNQLRWGQ